MSKVDDSCKVMEFERDIASIQLEGRTIVAGASCVITCYKEHGEMGWVPWFMITTGAGLVERINGRFVISVRYK
jgi:hypothetical protein